MFIVKKTDRGDTNCWDVGATELWPMSKWIPLLLSKLLILTFYFLHK